MKKPILLTLCLTLFLSFSYAQDEMPESITVVFSQNKVETGSIGKLYDMIESMGGPAMDEVVKAGHWRSWGILSHDWGDEWNFNIYYSADTKEDFFEGWRMYVKIMMEKYPDSWDEWNKHVLEHKDNIYHQETGSQWTIGANDDMEE